MLTRRPRLGNLLRKTDFKVCRRLSIQTLDLFRLKVYKKRNAKLKDYESCQKEDIGSDNLFKGILERSKQNNSEDSGSIKSSNRTTKRMYTPSSHSSEESDNTKHFYTSKKPKLDHSTYENQRYQDFTHDKLPDFNTNKKIKNLK